MAECREADSHHPDTPSTVADQCPVQTDVSSSVCSDPLTPCTIASPMSNLAMMESISPDHSASVMENASENPASAMENASSQNPASAMENALSQNSASGTVALPEYPSTMKKDTSLEYPFSVKAGENVSPDHAIPDDDDMIGCPPVPKRPRIDPTNRESFPIWVMQWLAHRDTDTITTMDNLDCDSGEGAADDIELSDLQVKTSVKLASPVRRDEESGKEITKFSMDGILGLCKKPLIKHSIDKILGVCAPDKKLDHSFESQQDMTDAQGHGLEGVDNLGYTSDECIGSSKKTEVDSKRLLMMAPNYHHCHSFIQKTAVTSTIPQGYCHQQSPSFSSPHILSGTYFTSLSNRNIHSLSTPLFIDTTVSHFAQPGYRAPNLMASTSQPFPKAVLPSSSAPNPKFILDFNTSLSQTLEANSFNPLCEPLVGLGTKPFIKPSFNSGMQRHFIPGTQSPDVPSTSFSCMQTSGAVHGVDAPSTSFSGTQISSAHCGADAPSTSFSGTQSSGALCGADVPCTVIHSSWRKRPAEVRMTVSEHLASSKDGWECPEINSDPESDASSSSHDSQPCQASVASVTAARRTFHTKRRLQARKSESKQLQQTVTCEMNNSGVHKNLSSVNHPDHLPYKGLVTLESTEKFEQNVTNFDNLPKEVLTHIFSFLPIATRLSIVMPVCQKWKSAVLDPSLWHVLDLQNFPRLKDNDLLQKARLSKKVKSLNLSGGQSTLLTDEGVSCVLGHCSYMEDLNLNNCNFLGNKTFSSISKYCHSLISLDLSGCFTLTDSALVTLSEGCTILKDLSISHCAKVTDVGVSAMAKSCPLRAFRLDMLRKVTDKGLKVICYHCPLLRILRMMGCSLTDESLVQLTELRNLKVLEISNVNQVSPDTLERIATSCTKLETLGLSLNLISDLGLLYVISCCKELRSLSMVSSCVTDTGLNHIAIFAKKLEQLDLAWSSNITDKGVAEIARSCPRLTYLSLLKCNLVTEEKVEELVSCYPHIHFSTFRQDSRRLLSRLL